jgi:dephospho-CoA kinase
MATQLPRATRLAQADDVIDNSGPPSAIEPQVERLDRLYRQLAAKARPTG